MKRPADPVLAYLDGRLTAPEEERFLEQAEQDPGVLEDLLTLSRQEAFLGEVDAKAAPVRRRWIAPALGGILAASLLLVVARPDPRDPEIPSPPDDGARAAVAEFIDHVGDGGEAYFGRIDAMLDRADLAFPAAEQALQEELRRQRMTLEEALGRYAVALRDNLTGEAERSEVRWAIPGGQEGPVRIYHLWALKEMLDVEVRAARGEPVLRHPSLAIQSFESLARKGRWSAAARCLLTPTIEEARRIHSVVAASRDKAPGRPHWGLVLEPSGRGVILLSDPCPIRMQDNLATGERRYSNTYAICHITAGRQPGEFLILDVLGGNIEPPSK